MFDLVGKRNWFFALSLLITIPGLIFILLTPLSGGKAGLQFSIDYTGGTTWSIKFADATVDPEAVKAELATLGQPDATVVRTGKGFLDIRLSKLDLRGVEPSPTPVPTVEPSPSASAAASPTAAASESPAPSASAAPSGSPEPSASASPSPSPSASVEPSPSASPSPSPSPTGIPGANTNVPTEGDIGAIATALQEKFGPIAEQASLSSIGAVVSSDLIGQAIVLILVGSIGILLWITLRFRDFKFGVVALVALVHDIIVVVGFFAILGTLFDIEIDGLFVTAMLTVIGFSVHDTIVVFDRIRENRARHAGEPFAEIVNHSLLQTFGRSITTSFTVVLTLTALFLFGGSATQEFVLALLLGIISGTYSSIFNASPLLVVWYEWEDRRHGRTARPVSRRASS
ncbi:MAG TPA: protein translocase subunit SecF [Candidatus Polarisedimenticolia bacterium]|nr:protein translocase subunit SecF [Candidatus Polarisedimenticolia bacterium]